MLLGAFVLAFLSGVAHAVWVSTGDNWYYADDPFGTIYCAGINSAVFTNSDVPNPNYVQAITDGKSHRDLFCVNPSNAPAGYNWAQTNLISGTGQVLCASSGWVANPNGNAVARGWFYYDTDSPAAPSNCRGGRYFRTQGYSDIALNFDWWSGSNSTGYAWQD